MRIFPLAAAAACLLVLASVNPAFAQCKYIISSAEEQPEPTPTPTPKPGDPIKPKIVNQQFTLEKGSSFKIVSDSAITSDYDRTGDWASFSVAENVYVQGTDVQDAKKTIRCLVIPKDTKVFGRADHVKQRTPFNINGKARVYVFVEKIKLEGIEVPISFVIKPATAAMSEHKIVRTCHNDESQRCVTGRRTRRDAPNDIGKAGADVLVNRENDEMSNKEIVFTFLGSVLGSAGLGVLINRPDAKIKAGHIFDVEVTDAKSIWLALPKAAEPDKPK